MFNKSYWIDETNPFKLRKKFDKILKDSGFTILNYSEYHFEPFGFTSLYLLSESHFAIHTFPEENKTYIEISSCVKLPFDNFIKNIITNE